MFDDLFAAAGKRREDYVTFVPCDPYYRIYNHQGCHFDYNGDEQFILNQIEQRNPANKEGYPKFMRTTKAIFEKGFVELADKPFLSVWDMIRLAPDLIKLQSYLSVYQYASKFVKDDFFNDFYPISWLVPAINIKCPTYGKI